MLKLCVYVIVTTVFYNIIRQMHQGVALCLKLICAAVLALECFSLCQNLLSGLSGLGYLQNEYLVYIKQLMRLICIGFMVDFVSNIAKEEGLYAVASELELYGKLTMVLMALPVLSELFSIIHKML